jgi:hypothetical protein
MSLFTENSNQQQWRDGGFSTAGAVFTLLVVIAVGGFAYLQLGGGTTGEEPSLNEVMIAHQSVESLGYNATLSADVGLEPETLQARDDAQQLQQSLQYLPELSSDRAFPKSMTGEITVSGSNTLAGTSSQAEGSFRVSVGVEELSDVIAFSWRRVGGMNYLRSEALPDIGFFRLSQYENQWYSASSSQATDSLSSFGGMGSVSVDDAEVSATTTKEIAKALFEQGLLSVENRTRTELQSGEPAWQIDMSISPQAVGDYQEAVKQIITENHPDIAESQDLEPTDAEIAQAQASLEQLNNQLDQFSVWIDGESNRLRRVLLKSDVTESEMATLKEQNDQYEGVNSATLSMDVALSSYNESIDVQAPDNAQPLQEAFGSLLGPGSGAGGSVPSSGSFGPNTPQPQGFSQ